MSHPPPPTPSPHLSSPLILQTPLPLEKSRVEETRQNEFGCQSSEPSEGSPRAAYIACHRFVTPIFRKGPFLKVQLVIARFDASLLHPLSRVTEVGRLTKCRETAKVSVPKIFQTLLLNNVSACLLYLTLEKGTQFLRNYSMRCFRAISETWDKKSTVAF